MFDLWNGPTVCWCGAHTNTLWHLHVWCGLLHTWFGPLSTLKCSPSHMQDIKQELQAISSSDPVEEDCFVDVMSVSIVPSEHKGNSVVGEEILEVGERGEWSTTK